MRPPWACVVCLLSCFSYYRSFVIRTNDQYRCGLRDKRLLPGAIEKWRLAVARRWVVLSTGRVFARRNEDEHPERRHYRPALGRQGCSPGTAKTVTAAAWLVKMCIFAIPTISTMFVPKRDSLGFVSINDFYDYIRCIFDDINQT